MRAGAPGRWRGWAARALAALVLAAPFVVHAEAEMTAADLGAYFDGLLPSLLDAADIAGAAVVVVKDGQVLFARGYGQADRDKQVPVSAEDTLFRIGSISKLFTWTAVMQLVEAGQLQLDADVQQYLDFPLPPSGGRPVTLRQLMTHTAGFGETIEAMWARPGESLDLQAYLREHVPARLFSPGTTTAYSNYGATLAGYIVERRSGLRFEDYVASRILQPLGMAHTTFAQPLPPTLARSMSQGYELGSGAPHAFELVRVAPAGGATASSTDIARFMLAHLGAAGPGGQRLLQPATLALMQSPQWRNHPAGPAMALGLWEDGSHAQRVIGHGGDTACFHSGLYLLPEQRIGLYFVQNSGGRHVLRDQVFRRFMARYLPAPPMAAASAPVAPQEGVEGHYVTSRRWASSPMQLVQLLSQAEVRRQADGSLTMSEAQGADGLPVRFRPAGGGMWQGTGDATRKLFFRPAPEGRWQMSGRVPIAVWDQVPWYRSAPLNRLLLGTCLLVSTLGLLLWPVAALVRRHHRVPAAPRRLLRARRMARLAAALVLLPWAVLGLALLVASADVSSVATGAFGHALRAVQVAAWLALAGLVVAAGAARVHWRHWAAGWWARLHGLMLVLAAIAGSVLAWQGGLLFWGGGF